MKRLMVIIALITVGCTQSEGATTTTKIPVRMPDGNNLVCQEVIPLTYYVSLKGCEPSLSMSSPIGNIECRHGVCWSVK